MAENSDQINEQDPNDVKDIDIKIDAFGRLEKNMNIEKLNSFLNDNFEDKKLTVTDKMSSKNEEE